MINLQSLPCCTVRSYLWSFIVAEPLSIGQMCECPGQMQKLLHPSCQYPNKQVLKWLAVCIIVILNTEEGRGRLKRRLQRSLKGLTIALPCLHGVPKRVTQVESGPDSTLPLIRSHDCSLVDAGLLYRMPHSLHRCNAFRQCNQA